MRVIRTVLTVIGAMATLAAAAVAALIFFSMRTPPVPEKTVLALGLDRDVPEQASGKFTPWNAFGKDRRSLRETVAGIERAGAQASGP